MRSLRVLVQAQEQQIVTNLREALGQNKLDKFIAERKGQTGDADAFDATLRSMVGKSKSVPETSSPDDCDD